MAIVQIDPEASRYPVLDEAGLYGHGLTHEADVELSRFEWPAAERMPAYDKDGKKGPYAYFGFVVNSPTKGKVFVDHWEPIAANSGSKAQQLLLDLGVITGDSLQFDDSTVAPRKLAGIEMGDPRKGNDGRLFSGRVLRVIG